MSSGPTPPGGTRRIPTPEPTPSPTRHRALPTLAWLPFARLPFPGLTLACLALLLFSTATPPVEAQIPTTPILPPTATLPSLRQGLTPVVFPFPSPTPRPSPTPLLPQLSIRDGTIREPVRGSANLLFPVILTPVAAQDITVGFITRGVGSAQAAFPFGSCGAADGPDYLFRTGAVTIPAGQSSRTASVTICADGRVEGTETFAVDLLAVTSGNFLIARASAVGTILDALITVDAGTFDLSPEQAIVGVGEPITYRFAWTVPEDRVWRDLNTLDLRLRPDADTETPGIWVRWEETGDTFSLCQATDAEAIDDPTSGQCGPGLPAGRFGVLEAAGATLFLVETVVEGSGPTGPTVTLTVSLSLLEAGRYLVEVAGDDDFGNRDGFFVVGNLQVGEPTEE